jgi:hypothetical protein
MTDEEIKITIAEFDGWKYNGLGPVGTLHSPNCSCFDGKECTMPDYLNDLNAIHEVEKKLKIGQAIECLKRLQEILIVEGNAPRLREALNSSSIDKLYHTIAFFVYATARQRSIAIVKTIGKWKD